MDKLHLKHLIKEVLSTPIKKDSCNCGCHDCDNVGNEGVVLNESLVKKDILSENLRYHVDKQLPLTKNTFRYGSEAFLNLWAEARSLYLREIIHVNEDDKEILEETNLGNFGLYEGVKVPLDLPMLEEEVNSGDLNKLNESIYTDPNTGKSYDLQYVSSKNRWELDITKKNSSIYDKVITIKRETVEEIIDWLEGYNIDSSWVKKSLNEENSKYPDFDLDKNIKYQDTSISSGMWRYTGKEQGGKGVYRNLNNDQFLGFASDDFDFFKKHLGSHFDISESLNEKEGVPHFTKDGKEWKGKVHKMPNGKLMTQNPHNEDSEELFHKEDLNKAEWPEKVMSRHSDIIFKLVKVMPDRAKYELIDAETDKIWEPGGRVYNSVEQLITNAEDTIKPQGGTQSTYLGEEADKKKNPPLGKPKRGGSKKFYVYVKNPKTKKIKKVSFGDTSGLSAKINNPKARKAFAARHDCKNKTDKTKASYWSCRLPRYAKLLGLKSSFSGFW
jgi:hypothetical protein